MSKTQIKHVKKFLADWKASHKCAYSVEFCKKRCHTAWLEIVYRIDAVENGRK